MALGIPDGWKTMVYRSMLVAVFMRALPGDAFSVDPATVAQQRLAFWIAGLGGGRFVNGGGCRSRF
jgi:hypothetical protein